MQDFRSRLIICAVILGIFFTVFLSRIFYLQILKGDEYYKFSAENSIRLIKIPAPRGRILDRNGKEIVINRPSFNLVAFPREIKDIDKVSAKLSEILGKPEFEINLLLKKLVRQNYYTPSPVVKDISRDELAQVEINRDKLKGVDIEVNYVRSYPNGNSGALILGYLGLASKKDLQERVNLDPDQQTGKFGIEKKLEDKLVGSKGQKYIVVDALGRKVKTSFFQDRLNDKESTPGRDIYLTIDIELQNTAEKLLEDKSGAIVAIDTRTGEILALASRPSFDLRDFSTSISDEKWQELIRDKDYPFLNRATQGTYPPGSVFKIVSAYAAMKEGVIDTDTKFYCPGSHKIGRRKFHCWKRGGHGWVDFKESLVKSCDVYYYQVADKLGIDKLSDYMKMFGFGSKTGFELTEKSGNVPTREWKMKNFKKPWYKGETAITTIGQGYLTVTPMQVAIMTAAVANDGTILAPTLVKRIEDEGKGNSEDHGKVNINLNSDIQKLIKNALWAVVNERGGTGGNARSELLDISGKTGTAQVVALDVEKDRKNYEDHAWFTSYAPSDDPEIAVTVLIENGGKGGAVAAPVAKKLIEQYYKPEEAQDDI